MVGDGDRIEAFVHVADVCRAVVHAHDHDDMVGEAYNVADESRITTAELFQLVCEELASERKPFMHVPLAVLLPVAQACQLGARLLGTKPWLEKATLQYLSFDRVWDNSKLKATGFELSYPLAPEGLRETVRWYRRHGWLGKN